LKLRHYLRVGLLAAITGCAPEPAAVPPPTSGPAAENKSPPRARLRKRSGDVKVKRAAGDDWLPAAADLPLYENDKLRTTAGASAEIGFVNGSVARIGEDALLSIAETRLTVLQGRVAAELDQPGRQSLTVATPSATVRAGREIVFQ
jgi:hypothetical protein